MKFNRNVDHDHVVYKKGDTCPKDLEKVMKEAGFLDAETEAKGKEKVPTLPKAGKAADASGHAPGESGIRVASVDQSQPVGDTEGADNLA